MHLNTIHYYPPKSLRNHSQISVWLLNSSIVYPPLNLYYTNSYGTIVTPFFRFVNTINTKRQIFALSCLVYRKYPVGILLIIIQIKLQANETLSHSHHSTYLTAPYIVLRSFLCSLTLFHD